MPGQNLRAGEKTVTIGREIKMTVADDQVEELLVRAKEEIGLASFLRGNLFADDKMLVVGL